jgi:hypothetical protein
MSPAKKKLSADQKLLLSLGGGILLLIVAIAVLSPQPARDLRPSTYNAGPAGVKAAYLMLDKLGRHPVRWTRPLSELPAAEAAHTTLVLADPVFDGTEREELAAQIEAFLNHGGRVLTTDHAGAQLLPHGAARAHSAMHDSLCMSTPEGPGRLAAAGPVEMEEHDQWAGEGPLFRVEQRCGTDAVVVRYPVGKGEAVWWTSAMPMDNAELKQDANLKLLLASLDGDDATPRTVVFDETLHGVARSLWDAAKGLPLRWLALQTAVLLLLLVLSFSRRRGPVRTPVLLPRSSPVEFAESMGDLYEKAGATSAATDAAKRRLLRVLTREAGVGQTAVQAGPAAIAEELQARLGGDWGVLAAHLEAAEGAHSGTTPRTALALVRALSEDAESLRARLKRKATSLETTVQGAA